MGYLRTSFHVLLRADVCGKPQGCSSSENHKNCVCLENSAGFLGSKGMLKIEQNVKNGKL